MLNNQQHTESSVKTIWKWNIDCSINKSIVNNDDDDNTTEIDDKEERSNIKSRELNQCYDLLAFELKQRQQHTVKESFCIFLTTELFSDLVKVIKSRLVMIWIVVTYIWWWSDDDKITQNTDLKDRSMNC